MDLNVRRRKRELAFAHELAEELLRAAPSLQGFPPALLAHHFRLTLAGHTLAA
jgi:hypothetical protein